MAGHEWEDWFEREELIGQISDIRVQNLQVERESVQKRTFTRWMNLHLEKCNPPVEVNDLFRDIQDGHILMALLEELSGCKLLHGFKKSAHRIFRLNNIAKVLSFLEERNVKLVSIDAADVADGNPSIVLGLIWNIILFFQIKELTGNLRSQFPSCSSLSSLPTSSDSDASSTPSDERPPSSNPHREHSKAIRKLLQWVQRRTRKYGVAVQDFGKSWTSGLAFLAVIKSIDSSLVDMRKALLRTPRENLEDAFRIAHYSLGIPRLLEPEDVSSPDEQSIMMYVSQFLEHFPGIEEPEEPLQVIERSVSMGRLNFRETDMDLFRNGHKGRVRQRSYMFQRDSAAPPPKILISSVSEDRGIVSPPFRPAAPRSWSTEDFLSDSPHTDEHKANEANKTNHPNVSKVANVANEANEANVTNKAKRDEEPTSPESPERDEEPTSPESPERDEEPTSPESPELRDSHSPTDSALPESIVGDSNISSPDSWMDSEYNVTAERFSESQSDGSLFDSGTAWDVYRATPVELTNSDEGLAPSEDARLSDELHDNYIDEGICSLSSLESALDRADGDKRDNGEDHKREAEMETRGREDAAGTKYDPSMDAADVNELDNDKEVTEAERRSRNEEKASVAGVKMNVQITDIDERALNEISQETQNEFPKLEKENVASAESKDTQILKSKSKIHDLSICEEAAETSHEASPSLAHVQGVTIPLISISSEPDDQELSGSDVEEHSGNEGLSESKETVETAFEAHEVVASCFITENIDLIASEETSDYKNEEFEIVEPSNGKEEYVELVEDTLEKCHSVEPEMVILVSGHEDGLCHTLLDKQTSVTQQPSAGLDKPNGNIVSVRDQPYTGSTSELVDLEPMDLFYPDKEEAVYSEPAESDVQSWPSVLSVSPLQPAPASQDLPDEPVLTQPEDDWAGGDVQPAGGKTLLESHSQVPASASDTRSAEPLSGGADVEDVEDVRAHPQSASAQDPRRSYINSCGGRDGNQIPPVLRHRKGARLEAADHQRSLTSAACRDLSSDYGLGDSWEPYVLLLLWLLLYCFWVLPQLDLNAVPSLFFNIRN